MKSFGSPLKMPGSPVRCGRGLRWDEVSGSPPVMMLSSYTPFKYDVLKYLLSNKKEKKYRNVLIKFNGVC